MKGKVVASIVPTRRPATRLLADNSSKLREGAGLCSTYNRQDVGTTEGPRKKQRRSGRWKPNGRRAIVLEFQGQNVALVKKGCTLVGAFIGSSAFVERHLHARGLDRSALRVVGEMADLPDSLFGEVPPGFRFRSEKA